MLRTALAVLLATAALAAAERPLVEIVTSKGTVRCALFADEAPETVATFLALAEGTREFTDPATGAKATRPFYDGLVFHRVIAGFMIQGGDPLGSGAGGPGFAFKDEINAGSLGLDKETVITGQGLSIEDIHPACRHQAGQFAQRYLLPRLEAQGLGPQTPPAEVEAAAMKLLPELRQITLRRFYEDLGYRYDDALPASHRPLRGVLAMANAGPNTNGSQFFINVVDTPHLTGKHTVFGEVVAGMDVVDAIAQVAVDGQSRPVEPVVIRSIRRVAEPAAPAPSP